MTWLNTEDDGYVRRITIDRPERKNAIPIDGWPLLRDAFEAFEASDLRVLVLQGAGGEFCAGADLDPSRLEVIQTVADRHRRMKLVGSVAMALSRISKPTIAAVDGVAVGAGMNLALGCDLVIATERARFAEIFARRGLVIDTGGGWLLPRIVGLQRAKELALTGRIVGAQEARDLGLVMEVVSPEDLSDRVNQHIQNLLVGAPIAQMFTKRILNASFESSLADTLASEGSSQAIALGTEDAAEGVRAFLQKRSPEWKGR